MEREVGIPIFKRSAKGVVATEKGKQFLQYAKAKKKPKKVLTAKDIHLGDTVRVLSMNLKGTVSTVHGYSYYERVYQFPFKEGMSISYFMAMGKEKKY